MYTYFIITPGFDVGSYVHYTDDKKGNYIKFGDSNSDHENSEGIRTAYMTHNPDIGIAAVMKSTAISGPNLGTRLKNYIIGTLGINPVGNSEWFSIKRDAAWVLFKAMQEWDGVTVDLNNLTDLTKAIAKALQ